MRIASVVLIALALAVGAQAGVVYTAVGAIGDDTYTFTFALPSDPTTAPDFDGKEPDDFSFTATVDESFDVAGVTTTGTLSDVTVSFWDAPSGGLVSMLWPGVGQDVNLYGPALFSGPPSAPVLLTSQSFTATAADNPGLPDTLPGLGDYDQNVFDGGYVTASAADLPEPGTFPLIIGGIMLLMPGLRKLRKSR